MSSTAEPTVVDPFDEQKPFIRSDRRYLGYISGVGAGKTFSGIIRTIRNMTEWNVGAMGAIIAPTRQMVVNVIIPEMRDLGLFDPPINWEYKSAYSDEPGIHAPNGSRALILSADNKQTIERLRGLNLAWVWIDEKTAVPARAQEIAMQRLRTGNYRNLYVTTTPKGKDDTYDFFVGDVDAKKKDYGQATLYETDDRRAIVGVPTSANPHTPDDYKEAMDSDLPDDIRMQEVMGEFIEVGGGVFTPGMFHWVDPEDVSDQVELVFGVDPAATIDHAKAQRNDSDYWAVTAAYIHPRKGEMYVADTQQRRGMTLQEGCEWLVSIQSELNEKAQMLVEANAAQNWLVGELESRGLNVRRVTTTRQKEDKLVDLSIPIANGTVKFADWSGRQEDFQELRNQMLSFPDGSHDDIMDSLALVVNNAGVTSQTMFSGTYRSGDLWG